MGSRVHRLHGASARRAGAERLWKADTQIVSEFLDAIQRHQVDALLLEQPRDELMARVFARGLDLGDGGEYRIRRAHVDALNGVGEDFCWRGIAAQRHGMNVAARSIVAVGVIEMQGVAGLREFLDADAAREFPRTQNPVPPEDIVEAGPNPRPRVFDDSAARGRRRRRMIVEETFELGVKIVRTSRPRCGLSCRTLESVWSSFSRYFPTSASGARSRASNSEGSARSRLPSAPGCSRRARDFGSIFDQAHGAPWSIHFLEQHAHVDLFVADEIGRVGEDAKAKRVSLFVRHVSLPGRNDQLPDELAPP